MSSLTKMTGGISQEVSKSLNEIAGLIGQGVLSLSYSLAINGGKDIVNAENSNLLVMKSDDGVYVFTGECYGAKIAWKFEPLKDGYKVSLDVSAEKSLYCETINSLIITYSPINSELSDCRLLITGPENGLLTYSDLKESQKENPMSWRMKMMNGFFDGSKKNGLFLGSIIPQSFKMQLVPSTCSDGIEFICSTDYPEGPSQMNHLTSESVWVCASKTSVEAIDTYASFIPEFAKQSKPPVGWNSWDYYYSSVSLDDIKENMAAIKSDKVLAENVKYIVTDMGWEANWGDWYPNYRFPGGLEELAEEVNAQGFIPGIWTAPIMVWFLSKTGLRNAECFIKDEDGDPFIFKSDGNDWFLLDPTHPKGKEFIKEIYTRLYKAGFRFFKVDYTSSLLDAPRFYDTTKGPFDVLADLFALIRECIGNDSHLLGCGFPKQCGAGYVDSGRIAIDIHNNWSHASWCFEGFMLSYWLNNRIWISDPDFLIVRGLDTAEDDAMNVTNPMQHKPNPPRWRRGSDFNYEEAKTWASICLASGGSIFFSDRISKLNEKGLDLLRKSIKPTGISAKPLDLCDNERATLWLQTMPEETRLYIINWEDTPQKRTINLKELGINSLIQVTEYWTSEIILIKNDLLDINIPAHGTKVLVWK